MTKYQKVSMSLYVPKEEADKVAEAFHAFYDATYEGVYGGTVGTQDDVSSELEEFWDEEYEL